MARYIFRSFLLLTALFAVPPVRALNPCTLQTATGNYLIYVDPVTFASANSSKSVFSDRLRFAVEANVQELQQKMFDDRQRNPKMPKVDVVPCDKQRAPQQTSDFTKKEIQSLDQSRVVLELWGFVIDPASGRGQLGYALVSATSQKIADPAVYTLNRVLGTNPETVQKAISKDPLLVAYATIAVGTRLYQNREYTSAASYLCSGAVKLKKVVVKESASTGSATFVAEQKSLLNGVIDLRAQALHQPGADSSIESTCPVEKLP